MELLLWGTELSCMGCCVWVLDALGVLEGEYLGVVGCGCMGGLGFPVVVCYLGSSVFSLRWGWECSDLTGRALALFTFRRPGGCGRRRCRWWK